VREVITKAAIQRRSYWVDEIRKLSGHFGDDSDRLQKEIVREVKRLGGPALLDHLRLCGAIPESYHHDSSEEKLYSKYTDILLWSAFNAVGLRSSVSKERADTADVEVFAKGYGFVADAKAFRLSRTAKNQKDFKIQAMDTWKRGKPYAIVVCPIYQLPASTSQIYQQASSRNVCIFTYSHLSVLISYASSKGNAKAQGLLREVFKVVNALNPTKDATSYWLAINRTMLGHSASIAKFWAIEKKAAVESIEIAKEEALGYLAKEREAIMRMSHQEALNELVKVRKLEGRERVIKSVADNGILALR